VVVLLPCRALLDVSVLANNEVRNNILAMDNIVLFVIKEFFLCVPSRLCAFALDLDLDVVLYLAMF